MMTMNIGTILLPRALAAAMVQSINAEIQYENPMIVRRYIPAFITAASLVNRDKNALPKNTSDTPRIRPMPKEYARLMR
jgi:hypothetical protein